MITLKNFAKMHSKKSKEILSLLKENIDEVNSDDEHAKFVDGEWSFDDVAVDFLEKMMPPQNDFSFPEPTFLKKSAENNFSQNVSESEFLKKQITELQQALQLAQENAKSKDEEFKILQSRILNYEEGASSINGDLIRKYQQKSERLEKELEQSRSDMTKLRDLKDGHISKQETAIRELQNKISELNDIIKKKMESDMENLRKSISEDKLKSDIHKLELKLADSEREKERVRISLEDSQIKNAELCNLIDASVKTLVKVQQNLRGGIEVQSLETKSAEENSTTFVQQEKTLPEISEPVLDVPKVGFFRRMLKSAGLF